MTCPTPSTTHAPPLGLLSPDFNDLGVTLGPDGGTLRVWSGAASSVELLIFDRTDLDWITDTLPLTPGSGDVWSVATPLLRPGTAYAIRVDGPHGPGAIATNGLLHDAVVAQLAE